MCSYCSKNSLRLIFAVVTAALLAGMWLLTMRLPGRAAAQSSPCNTSTNTTIASTYTITLCITSPADAATLTGPVAVAVSVAITHTGPIPGVEKILYNLNSGYLLTAFQSPFAFSLPTQKFMDVTSVPLSAQLRTNDGFMTPPVTVTVSLSNSNAITPTNTSPFTPTTGTTPPLGQPFIVAAVGDGASGQVTGTSVVNLISSWNPNMFLYLGDVYEKGSVTEFYNWYGNPPTNFYGTFKSITNPTAGLHEYLLSPDPTKPYTPTGYTDYWGQMQNTYYSFDAGGWHFISLNTNCVDVGGCNLGKPQYDWLLSDLAANASATCKLVYYHTPFFNLGPESTSPFTDTWSLMAQNKVDIVLNANDHNFQHWKPLDATGNVSAGGITEFVVGTGGHSIQHFSKNDSRAAVGFDNTTSPLPYGALRLELSSNGAIYRFFNTAGTQLDAGTITCSGATGPGPSFTYLPLIMKQ